MSDSQKYHTGAAEESDFYRVNGIQENTIQDDGFVSETDSVETIRPGRYNRQSEPQNQASENQDLVLENTVRPVGSQGDSNEDAGRDISLPFIPPVPDRPPPPVPAPERRPPLPPPRLSSLPSNTLPNNDSEDNKNGKYTNTSQPWILPPTNAPPLYSHSFTGAVDPLRMHPYQHDHPAVPRPSPSASVPDFLAIPASASASSVTGPYSDSSFGAGGGNGKGKGLTSSATSASMLAQHRYDGNPFTPRGQVVRAKVDRMLKASRSLKPLVSEKEEEAVVKWERLEERVGVAVGVPLGNTMGAGKGAAAGAAAGTVAGSSAGPAAIPGAVQSATTVSASTVESAAATEPATAADAKKAKKKLFRLLNKLSSSSSRIFSSSKQSNTGSKGNQSNKPRLPAIGVPKPHQIRHVTGVAAAVGASTLSLPGFSLPEDMARDLSSAPVLEPIFDAPFPDLPSNLQRSRETTKTRRRSRSLNPRDFRDPIPSMLLRENERVNVLRREKSLWVLGEGPTAEEDLGGSVPEEERQEEQSGQNKQDQEETETKTSATETPTETPITDAARTGPTPRGAPAAQLVSSQPPAFAASSGPSCSPRYAPPVASGNTSLQYNETDHNEWYSQHEQSQPRDNEQAPETENEQVWAWVLARGAVMESAEEVADRARSVERRAAAAIDGVLAQFQLPPPPPPRQRVNPGRRQTALANPASAALPLLGSSTDGNNNNNANSDEEADSRWRIVRQRLLDELLATLHGEDGGQDPHHQGPSSRRWDTPLLPPAPLPVSRATSTARPTATAAVTAAAPAPAPARATARPAMSRRSRRRRYVAPNWVDFDSWVSEMERRQAAARARETGQEEGN